jgi:hypothetical protein
MYRLSYRRRLPLCAMGWACHPVNVHHLRFVTAVSRPYRIAYAYTSHTRLLLC